MGDKMDQMKHSRQEGAKQKKRPRGVAALTVHPLDWQKAMGAALQTGRYPKRKPKDPKPPKK